MLIFYDLFTYIEELFLIKLILMCVSILFASLSVQVGHWLLFISATHTPVKPWKTLKKPVWDVFWIDLYIFWLLSVSAWLCHLWADTDFSFWSTVFKMCKKYELLCRSKFDVTEIYHHVDKLIKLHLYKIF